MNFKINIVILFFFIFIASGDCYLGHNFWQHIQELPLFEMPFYESIEFADFLYDNGMYDDAIGEYERFLFGNPHSRTSDYALFQKAQCYFHQNLFAEARGALNELNYNTADIEVAFNARLIIGLSFVATNDLSRARFELHELSRHSSEDKQGLIKYFFGWLDLIEGDFASATANFSFTFRDSITPIHFQRSAYEIHRWFNAENPNIPEKSPEFAALMSGIIPGSGQVYAGDILDGFNSLVLNAAFGYLSISSFIDAKFVKGAYILYFVWKRYYLGGIRNAEFAVNDFNQSTRDEIIASLMDAFLVER